MKLKILTTVLVLSSGIAESIVNPGPLDSLNALVGAFVIYFMFFRVETAK